MTISDLVKKLSAETYNLPEPDKEIVGGYCGDFLSFVMGKAQSNTAWFTVMSNVNVCAVACLADVSVVVVCEGVVPDPLLVKKAKEQEMAIISVKLPIYEAVLKMNE